MEEVVEKKSLEEAVSKKAGTRDPTAERTKSCHAQLVANGKDFQKTVRAILREDITRKSIHHLYLVLALTVTQNSFRTTHGRHCHGLECLTWSMLLINSG